MGDKILRVLTVCYTKRKSHRFIQTYEMVTAAGTMEKQ